MKRVTGIGGIFFKAKDAPALQAWYNPRGDYTTNSSWRIRKSRGVRSRREGIDWRTSMARSTIR